MGSTSPSCTLLVGGLDVSEGVSLECFRGSFSRGPSKSFPECLSPTLSARSKINSAPFKTDITSGDTSKSSQVGSKKNSEDLPLVPCSGSLLGGGARAPVEICVGSIFTPKTSEPKLGSSLGESRVGEGRPKGTRAPASSLSASLKTGFSSPPYLSPFALAAFRHFSKRKTALL